MVLYRKTPKAGMYKMFYNGTYCGLAMKQNGIFTVELESQFVKDEVYFLSGRSMAELKTVIENKLNPQAQIPIRYAGRENKSLMLEVISNVGDRGLFTFEGA